jgi:hypothetical protein
MYYKEFNETLNREVEYHLVEPPYSVTTRVGITWIYKSFDDLVDLLKMQYSLDPTRFNRMENVEHFGIKDITELRDEPTYSIKMDWYYKITGQPLPPLSQGLHIQLSTFIGSYIAIQEMSIENVKLQLKIRECILEDANYRSRDIPRALRDFILLNGRLTGKFPFELFAVYKLEETAPPPSPKISKPTEKELSKKANKSHQQKKKEKEEYERQVREAELRKFQQQQQKRKNKK